MYYRGRFVVVARSLYTPPFLFLSVFYFSVVGCSSFRGVSLYLE